MVVVVVQVVVLEVHLILAAQGVLAVVLAKVAGVVVVVVLAVLVIVVVNAFQTILWFSKIGLDDVFMPILTE